MSFPTTSKLIFITGTDTGIGKTYITGTIAKILMELNISVTTMKPIQTGSIDIADDIITHRKIMGIKPTDFDLDHTTNPYNLPFPASPHLSAKLANIDIDINKIKENISILTKHYNVILIEGAGGILVPIKETYTFVDLIKEINADVILVTTPKLGTLNHTFLTIELLKNREIKLFCVVYNTFFTEKDEIMTNNLLTMKKFYPSINFITPNEIKNLLELYNF